MHQPRKPSADDDERFFDEERSAPPRPLPECRDPAAFRAALETGLRLLRGVQPEAVRARAT